MKLRSLFGAKDAFLIEIVLITEVDDEENQPRNTSAGSVNCAESIDGRAGRSGLPKMVIWARIPSHAPRRDCHALDYLAYTPPEAVVV
jgi:hypothetical protein